MKAVFQAKNLSKRFGSVLALRNLTLEIPEQSVVGLIGPNGSGKTTLLHHVTGLYLPSEGECATFGHPSGELGASQLSRIGVVQQKGRFLEWMTVRQQLQYVATFYRSWDRGLEARLVSELDLDPGTRVINLSPGNAQKLAIVLAVCHRPDFLILDEPVSALDPIAREQLFRFLFELLSERPMSIVVSSHVLRDIERLVDRITCLSEGRLRADAPLDELQERYAEWRLTSSSALPRGFDEPFILQQEVNRTQARLFVRDAQSELPQFARKHDVEVDVKPLNLESMYRFLIEEDGS